MTYSSLDIQTVRFLTDFYESHLDSLNWDQICTNTTLPPDFFEKHFDKIVKEFALPTFWANAKIRTPFLYKKFDIID